MPTTTPLYASAPSTQVNFAGQALGCSAGSDTPPTDVDGKQDQDDTAANGDADTNGSTGNDADKGGAAAEAAANGKLQYPPRPEEQNKELFALSNTEDNDSIQGLVRSGGYVWIGRFRLPPAQPGEDESEVGKKGDPFAAGREQRRPCRTLQPQPEPGNRGVLL